MPFSLAWPERKSRERGIPDRERSVERSDEGGYAAKALDELEGYASLTIPLKESLLSPSIESRSTPVSLGYLLKT
jgi:hypothetical protein